MWTEGPADGTVFRRSHRGGSQSTVTRDLLRSRQRREGLWRGGSRMAGLTQE